MHRTQEFRGTEYVEPKLSAVEVWPLSLVISCHFISPVISCTLDCCKAGFLDCDPMFPIVFLVDGFNCHLVAAFLDILVNIHVDQSSFGSPSGFQVDGKNISILYTRQVLAISTHGCDGELLPTETGNRR